MEDFGPERWAGGEDGVATVESNYGFLAFLAGPRGGLGMCLLRWGLSVFLRLRLAGSSLRRGSWLLRRGPPRNLRGISVSVKEVVWGEFFVYFVNIVFLSRDEGKKEERMERMEGIMCGHSTLSALSYD